MKRVSIEPGGRGHLLRGTGGRVLTALLAAALLLGLTACTPRGTAPEPTATPQTTSSPAPLSPTAEFVLPCYLDAGFHPVLGTNKTNLAIGGLIYEGLFALDEQFVPQGELCTGYTVAEDGLTWHLALRAGVTFSDGSPLTGADVAAALNAARASALYAPRLSGISGIIGEAGAVTVTLNAPNGNLPALLDIPISKGTGNRPLGTGPYWMADDITRLVANANWWQGKTLPRQEIPLRQIAATDDLIFAFDTQEISLVTSDLTGTNALGYSGSFETVDYATTVMLYMGFNAATGPCRDETVRRALLFGLDRTSVATALLARHALPATLPAAPGAPVYDKALADTLNYAPKTVGEVLEAGGWSIDEGVYQKGRDKLTLTMLVASDNTARVAVADFLAQNLTQAGVAVTVKKLLWEDYIAALARGEFDLYLGEVRMTADFDPTVLLSPSGALNYGGYADGRVDELLYAYRAATADARPAAAKALYTRLAENPPFGVICFKNWSILTQWKLVSGATPTQQNIFYRIADWAIGT